MKLVERFRSQPRSKHPDPGVRLAYVGEIPLTDRESIGAMAREDDDPRVRRAAVAKLMDPSLLGSIAAGDPDEDVRATAMSMLKDIALESFEDITEYDSLAAVDAIADARTLAAIARAAARDAVALRALARITDPHALGSVARHAAAETARRFAFERLRDEGRHEELLSLALNGEYKDSALEAVDHLTSRDELEQIASRGRNKAASRKARGILREAEERDARERAAALEAERTIAALSMEPPTAMVVAEPAQLETASPSQEAAAATPEIDERAEAERREIERRETELARERLAAEAAAKELERRRPRLTELSEEASAAPGENDVVAARRRFDLARREWRDLASGIQVPAELSERVAEAEKAIVEREAAARDAEARARREALNRVQQLVARVEAFAAKPDTSLKALERALNDIRSAIASPQPLPTKQDHDEMVKRLRAAQATLTPRVQEMREAADWQRFANVTIQEQLCARMEALASVEDADAVARQVREMQQEWRGAADVPRAQAEALWKRFKSAHDVVWPRCEAHFEAERQARAGNLARKTALCEQAETLASSSNWIQTAEEIKRLQAEWKAIGPVGRAREQPLWDRFRTACDRFFVRRRDDLQQRKTMWAGNLERKEALCARAEALAESSDWDATAAEIRRLQAEWKTTGPVKRSRSDAIWHRFRAACDRFFARYADRHNVARAERVAAREAVTTEAEALASHEGADAPADLLTSARTLRGRWQQEINARGVDPDTARRLDDRFAAALQAIVSRWPETFRSTELDADGNRQKMETLVKRAEDLAASLRGPARSDEDALSPTARLATMLKEALAANTIGGKADEEGRFRAALEDVRQAEAAWSRIGMVPAPARRELGDRFARACREITERAGRAGQAGRAGGAGQAGRAGRPNR